jgi:hypothetical protein
MSINTDPTKSQGEMADVILDEIKTGITGPSQDELINEALENNDNAGSSIITNLSNAFSMEGVFGEWWEVNKDASIDVFAEAVSHMAVRTVQFSTVGLVPEDTAVGRLLRSKYMDALMYAALSQGVVLGSSAMTSVHPKFQYLGGAAARLSLRKTAGILNLAELGGKFNPILRRFFN